MESPNEKSNEQDRIGAARMRFGEIQSGQRELFWKEIGADPLLSIVSIIIKLGGRV